MPSARRPTITSLIPSLCLLWPSAAWPAGAQTFTNLYAFSTVNYANGAYPNGDLAIDGNGVLYGTTQMGGAYNACYAGSNEGCGTVYSLKPPASPGEPWTETVLWSFGATSADAYNPSGVTMGSGGVLYGVAGGGEFGYGTVFSLTPPSKFSRAWVETVLYRFGGAPDAAIPNAGLVIGADGVLYCTSDEGGTGACGSFACGTVFSLAPPSSAEGNWTETVLWSFGGTGDGTGPQSGVALGAGGVLYGVTHDGGTGGSGIAYSLAPPEVAGGAWAETVLYTFPESAKEHPVALAPGAAGALYGTTDLEAGRDEGGTAFSLTPPSSQEGSWADATIATFPARGTGESPSHQPNGPLAFQKKSGALFGVTAQAHRVEGTIFELVPPKAGSGAWKHRVLDTGHTTYATLGVMNGGVIYGTDYIYNTVWSLAP